MSKIIDADESTIKALLDNSNSSFVVPRHQRQFEWNKEQWSDLWNDIKTGEIEDSHFLGSIVVIPSDRAGFKINNFEVNDGQQRLTTILILLSAIRDHAQKIGNSEFAQYIYEHYLSSNFLDGSSKKVVAKMTLGLLDNQEFGKVCKGDLLNNPQDNNHRIFECYNYFISLISNYTFEELEEISERVINKIIVVYINVADKLNAFRLFETLNDRGLALSAVDLIKNHLLMRAASDGNDILLNSIVEEWLEMYQKIRNYDPVTFFYRFILSEYPGKISAQQLYEVISKRAKDENWDAKYISEFTIKLKNAAAIYSELMDANIGIPKIDRRLSDIKFFEASPSYTLLIKITPLLKSGELSEDQYLKVIDLIELFHIRWGICGQSTSRLSDIYNRICNKINLTNSKDIPNIVEDEYLAVASSISDSIFQAAFQNEFAQPSATRTKYIIWKLGNPAGEISLNFDEVHTEHIMPQTLSREWVSDLEISSGLEESEVKKNHDVLMNKIGNFALIKGEWNISMSNKVFSEKKNYYINSEINLTKELFNKSSWTFDEIVDRTEELANKAVEIWKFSKPIPTVSLNSRESIGKIYSIDEDTDIYCKGPGASAVANVINKSSIRVHKGSIAKKETSNSFETHSYIKLRNQLINDGILIEDGDSLIFTSDYDFQSPSAAACIVLGTPSNGQSAWRDINGDQLGNLSIETDEEIIARVKNDFEKQAVRLIPEWINKEYPNGKLYVKNGNSGSNRSIKDEKGLVLYYYFADNWIYGELQMTTQKELNLLKEQLSKPEEVLDRSDKRNQVRFHLINENDLAVIQGIINNRYKGQ